MIKKYSELIKLETYDERLNYLRLRSSIGIETFGDERYFNQQFYRSIEWKRARDFVMIRDNGCDLGILELPIRGRVVIHHLNPISMKDLKEGLSILFDPENLITCSFETHNAIHYGVVVEHGGFVERKPNDTSPWKVK